MCLCVCVFVVVGRQEQQNGPRLDGMRNHIRKHQNAATRTREQQQQRQQRGPEGQRNQQQPAQNKEGNFISSKDNRHDKKSAGTMGCGYSTGAKSDDDARRDPNVIDPIVTGVSKPKKDPEQPVRMHNQMDDAASYV